MELNAAVSAFGRHPLVTRRDNVNVVTERC
jgi:hypothetical protein